MNGGVARKREPVSLLQLQSYLVSKQWSMEGTLRQVATIWRRSDDSDAEVVLPAAESLKDFEQRISDALNSIAEQEQRPVSEVLIDVRRAFADLIAVRVIHDDTSEGTIPINDGVLLVARARDMLKSAALALYAKRRQFSGHPTDEAKAYLDSLLLGQTEIGSYVINVFAPIPPAQASSTPEGFPTVPLATAVTASLASGLEALSAATTDYGQRHDLSAFDSAVQRGASSNLCDALLGLSGQDRKRAFEIRISAARSPMFEGENKVFAFDAKQVTALAKASEYYKDTYVLPDRTVTGVIKRLDRPVGSETGTVMVATKITDQDKHVAIELGAADYDLAIMAHRQHEVVSCAGDIHVTPRTAKLLNPRDFRVLRSGSLF